MGQYRDFDSRASTASRGRGGDTVRGAAGADPISSRPSTGGPFASAYRQYRELGWGPVPVPAGAKWAPPTGFTGSNHPLPTLSDCRRWVREAPDSNIVLPLFHGMVGADRDFWKMGMREAWQAEVERLGPWPETFRSTSRDDGSGILLARIPEGVKLDGKLSWGEFVQEHHRYVMSWPSVFEGRTYYWYYGSDERGWERCDPPSVDDLPEMPKTWLDAYAVSPLKARNRGRRVDAASRQQVRQWLRQLP